MKKVLTALFILIGGAGYAQTFQLGVKGGVNVSNYTGNFRQIDKEALVGFHIGGMLNFKLGNNFSLGPEVLFSSQGAKIDEGNGLQDYKVSYINVPVIARVRTNGGFYVEAGPQVGFKLTENTDNTPINTFAKNLDLSGAVGLGYHGASGFGVGVRYIAGLSKVGDFNSQNIDPDFKNSVLMGSVFFTLFNNK